MPTFLTLLKVGPWAAILLLIGVVAFQSDKIHDWHKQADHCAEARKADRASYEQAQTLAAEKNKAEVQRIEQEQERISNAVQSDLAARLERLRSELRQGASAAPGSAGGAKAGPDGIPAQGASGASGVCLAPEELLRGAENEERHDQLITWVERQLKVQR